METLEHPDDGRHLEPDVPPSFRGAFKAIAAAQATYRRLNAMTAAAEGYVEPGRFAETLRHEVVPGDTADAFFRWAENRNGVSSLLLVLGALDALDRGDQNLAFRRSMRALAADSNNLHVQFVARRVDGVDDGLLGGRFCSAPFQNIETAPGGDVYFCCPAWLPVPIGRLEDQNGPDAVWNSPAAQEIRRSIHDGDYRYCSRKHCPHLSLNRLPRKEEVKNAELRATAAARTTKMARGPKKIVLSHDRSCNLSCPSCRTTTILARKEEQGQLNRIADAVILPMLQDADRVHVTGSGDPFASAHFRYVLKQLSREAYPRLRLDIQTNGVLFDEAAWRSLDLEGRLDRVAVSIDAATDATYRIVRRGGDFSRLFANLAVLSRMKARGAVRTTRLDCVVQTLNFREMPDVIAIADRFGFDGVKFQMIRNWGTYTREAFAANNIGSRDHPDYAAFIRVLQDPLLQDDRIEFWGMADALSDAREVRTADDESENQLVAWPTVT